ncbi:MAG: signal peptidase I [Vicinamibacterales bacterium]
MKIALALIFGVAMTGWVAIDADRRGRHWFSWAALVALTGIIGLVVWLGIRRRYPPLPEPATVTRRAGLAFAGVPLMLVTFMVTGFIVTFVLQVARVEGGAMAPALENQDRVIVNKLAYQRGEPHVGDIVMLYYPLNPEKLFVKRVMGEEGDQIRVARGVVWRNNVPMDDSFVPQEFRSNDNWGPQVIPEGYYFVMGDHRNNSLDSRHWGFVPKKYILGRVQCRWWPINQAECF